MRKSSGQVLTGALIVALGLIFLFDIKIGELVRRGWPVFLIIFGLYLVFDRRRRPADSKLRLLDGESGESGIPGLAGDIKVAGLKDGIGNIDKKILLGDIVMDLTDSKLLPGENVIDVSILAGNITITLPEGFSVKVDLVACAGDLEFKDKRSDGLFSSIKHSDDNYANAEARLFIKGKICFGDIKVFVGSNKKE